MGIDFSKYSKTSDLIKECEMTEMADQIIWLQQEKEDAAVNLAAMHILCKAALSNNINQRRIAKEKTDHYYSTIGPTIHVFARAQARAELGLTDEDVTRLYKHIELGGRRYT
ncbi:hypothetical protein ABEV55_08390 [Aneurinibacillus thermoaerophilus]|uniref:hypothetical protein n=1 Tax=Aneurinibacillus thermoaerophilus TaxID=143495 RepID=UPI002E21A04E|nr:hypothetical protein [Aneurinibacillus thermoaerophilus]